MLTRRTLLGTAFAAAVLRRPALARDTTTDATAMSPRPWFVDHVGWVIPAGDRDALVASPPPSAQAVAARVERDRAVDT